MDHDVGPLYSLGRQTVALIHLRWMVVSAALVRPCSLRLRLTMRVLRQLVQLDVPVQSLLSVGVTPKSLDANVQRSLMNGRLRLPCTHLAAQFTLIPVGVGLSTRLWPRYYAVLLHARVARVAFLAQISLVVVVDALLSRVADGAVLACRIRCSVDNHLLDVLLSLEVTEDACFAIRQVWWLDQRNIGVHLVESIVVNRVRHLVRLPLSFEYVFQPLLVVVCVLWLFSGTFAKLRWLECHVHSR